MKEIMMLICVVTCLVISSGCSIGRKSWGVATSVDAFRVVLADPKNASVVPEVIAGGGSHCMLFQTAYEKDANYPPMFSYSRRKSLWGIFSSDMNSSNVSCLYIAGAGESPSDTVKIINALAKVVNIENTQIKTK